MVLLNFLGISDNLKKRIISSIILVPVVLCVTFYGGAAFAAFVVLVAVLMSFEWAAIIASKSMMDDKKQIKWRISGVFYVAIFGTSLLYLRSVEHHGLVYVLFPAMSVWATDIAAFFVGKTVGGPKILPSVSPKKTWSGLLGGMLAAAFVGGGFSVMIPQSTLLGMMLLGGLLALISQVGDFFESWVKRQFEVKDSGNLIPGHGGVMDRVDGLVTVFPFFMLYVLVTGGSFF